MDIRPGEFVMCTLFADFTVQAEKKMEAVMAEPQVWNIYIYIKLQEHTLFLFGNMSVSNNKDGDAEDVNGGGGGGGGDNSSDYDDDDHGGDDDTNNFTHHTQPNPISTQAKPN